MTKRNTTTSLTDLGSLWDSLSNLELQVVLDGGTVVVTAQAPGSDEWAMACVDADGLWLDEPSDPGYVRPLRGWKVSRTY